MAFLNPLMLFGIAAVSVPIIIHLLNKRKFQRVTWAAMRFLKASIEKNQRRMQIEDLLLLLLRCVMVALLAILLARPTIRAATASGLFGKAETAAIIIIDNSYSMGQTNGVDSRFDQARAAATQVIASLPTGSSAAVLLASDVVHGLIPEPTYDLNLARKTVSDDAQLSDRTSDIFPAIRQGLEILARKSALRKEIYVISDGQQIGWRQLTAIKQALEAARQQVQANLIFISGNQDRNLAISDLRMASGLPAIDQPLRFEVQVSNTGSVDATNTRVSLSMNGDPFAVDETTIDSIPPGTSKSVSLFARLRSDGYHSVTASLSADHLPADDTQSVAVRAVTQARVLLVDGDRGREAREAETFFLRHGLMPVTASDASRYFIQVTTIAPLELDNARLDDFDAVALANIPDVSDRTLESIEAYLRRGGGLLIFPGNNTRASFYNEKMFNERRWLPAEFGELQGDEKNTEQFRKLQSQDFGHPIASIWRDPASGSPSSAHFYKSYVLKADTRGATDDAGEPLVILSYSDKSPAVIERSRGQGKVIQFSSSADSSWNDLPLRPGIYVPLVRRCLGAIVQRQDEAINIRVGQRFAWRAPAELLGRDVLVTPPGNDPLKDSRKIEMVDRTPMLLFDSTDRGGVYKATISADQPIEMLFAAQPDASESQLREMSQMQKDSLKGVSNVIDFAPGASLEATIEQQRVGTELWYPLAIALIVLALTESFLGHWFSRSK